MNLSRLVILLLSFIALSPISFSHAGTLRTATKDTTCFPGGACGDTSGVQVASSILPSACSDSQIGYMGWNLSSIAVTIQSATLTLQTYNVSGVPGGDVTFQLVTPNDHTWTENGSDPGYGTVIATTTATLVDGTATQTVTFGGSGNPTAANSVGAYFEGLRTGTTPANATIGIRISGGCTLSTNISFNDSEDSGGMTSGDPDLLFYTGPGATALTLTSFSTARPGTPYPLLAGLIGLFGLALIWMRRR